MRKTYQLGHKARTEDPEALNVTLTNGKPNSIRPFLAKNPNNTGTSWLNKKGKEQTTKNSKSFVSLCTANTSKVRKTSDNTTPK